MTEQVPTICNKLLAEGVSADGLIDLACACRENARRSSPVLLWLGLENLFRTVAKSIDDRGVPTSEIDDITSQLRRILQQLTTPRVAQPDVENSLTQLRELL